MQEGNRDSDVTTSKVFYIKNFVIETGPGRLWSWGHNTRGQLGLGDGLYAGDPRFPNEVCMHVCVYVYVYVCVYTYCMLAIPGFRMRYACMHVCVCVYVCVYILYAGDPRFPNEVCMHVCVCMCVCVCIHIVCWRSQVSE